MVPALMTALSWLRNGAVRWRVVRLDWQSAAILRAASRLHSLSCGELRQRSTDLRWNALQGGNATDLVQEALPLVCEVIRREMGFTLHQEQVLGGLALVHECMAQMQTGEGKTLTALLPAFVHALSGRGVHVLTANDYLAGRDAELACRILSPLGVSVGQIHPELDTADRRKAYGCDITYGTAKEVGFDFLRDRLRETPQGFAEGGESVGDVGVQQPVQRGRYFALVDEADSLLIDEARTPLLIATRDVLGAAERSLIVWSHRAVSGLQPETDFHWDQRTRTARLTDAGCLRLLRLSRPTVLEGFDTERLYQQVEQSLTAQHGFALDQHYIVDEGQVSIVDESTGRILDGRRWQQGLHQAIEVKEGLTTSDATRTAARITVQSLFRSYRRLAGLTGTARSAASEFQSTYQRRVVTIPTHRPCRRQTWPTRIFLTLEHKRRAIARDVERLISEGRAVLVGTPSIAESERLAGMLALVGIRAEVLNCRAHDREAQLVARAGEPGRVTIATNMAGRGTDIRVSPDVLARGGLHVIGTERHSSRRIDDQLVGRTSRQGEPGSCQFLLSLEDDLLIRIRADLRKRWLRKGASLVSSEGELPRNWSALFDQVQRETERDHRRQRRELLAHERRQRDLCRETGLDPCLDFLE